MMTRKVKQEIELLQQFMVCGKCGAIAGGSKLSGCNLILQESDIENWGYFRSKDYCATCIAPVLELLG